MGLSLRWRCLNDPCYPQGHVTQIQSRETVLSPLQPLLLEIINGDFSLKITGKLSGTSHFLFSGTLSIMKTSCAADTHLATDLTLQKTSWHAILFASELKKAHQSPIYSNHCPRSCWPPKFKSQQWGTSTCLWLRAQQNLIPPLTDWVFPSIKIRDVLGWSVISPSKMLSLIWASSRA